MTTETRKRRDYTEEFKRDAVAPVTEQGYKPSEAARSLGIGDNLIRRWKREFEEAAPGAGLGADEREELMRLRKEVRMLCNFPYSHSMVAGGLPEISYATREMCGTSLMIRRDTVSRNS